MFRLHIIEKCRTSLMPSIHPVSHSLELSECDAVFVFQNECPIDFGGSHLGARLFRELERCAAHIDGEYGHCDECCRNQCLLPESLFQKLIEETEKNEW